MSEKLTEEEMEFLTPDERAALVEDQDAEDVTEEGGEDEATSEADDADEGGEEGDDGADEKVDEAAKADGAEDTTGGEPEPEPQPEPVVPLLKADAPEDAKAKLDDIKTRKGDLAQKFDDGELSARDYSTQLDALNDEAEAVKQAIFKGQLSQEMAQQQTEQAWVRDVRDFATDHPEIGANELRWNSFDMVVRKVTADPANAKLSNRQMLAKAHATWASDLGLKVDAKPKAEVPPKAKVDRRVPPSLAKIPAADANDTDDGRWASLDRLAATNPDAYEQKLARLSAAELEEYERVSA